MDTSESYIKMCGKAGEIQEMWQKTKEHYLNGYDGSYYYVSRIDNIDNGIRCVDYEYNSCESSVQVWLPRQDQLQEMISGDWKKVLSILFAYAKNYDMTKCESMEQLCIAFVMKEKFGKVWNGENWVKGQNP